MNSIVAPISLGELIDKITILEIKESKLKNNKVNNVINELNQLKTILNNLDFVIEENLIDKLREVNKNLQEIEDLIRLKEKEEIEVGVEFKVKRILEDKSLFLKNTKHKITINPQDFKKLELVNVGILFFFYFDCIQNLVMKMIYFFP